MKKIFFAFVGLVLIGGLAAPAAQAQEEGERPNVVAFSEWKCGIGDLGEALDIVDQTSRPIYGEMVDEGMINGFSVLTHLYGDEWNLIFVTLASDIDAAIAASTEANRRMADREMDEQGDRFVELCPYHRDNIYSIQHGDAAEEM